jgi:hypothetical protein
MGCRTVFESTENGHLMLTLSVAALQRRRLSKRVMVEMFRTREDAGAKSWAFE